MFWKHKLYFIRALINFAWGASRKVKAGRADWIRVRIQDGREIARVRPVIAGNLIIRVTRRLNYSRSIGQERGI